MTSGIRIALNTTALLSPLTGIGQYTLNLGKALESIPGMTVDLYYGYTWSHGIGSTAPPVMLGPVKRWVKRWIPHPYEVTRYFQQQIFTGGVATRRPDIYHEPNFLPYRFDGPTVITVHDLSWIRYPETHPRERVKIMDKLLPPAVRDAAHICVDSEFVRGEVIEYFGLPPEKVTTTLLAPRDVFRPRSAEQRLPTLTKHSLTDQQYFLCVGTLEPRKNVVAAIRAHARLPQALRQRFPLVLVGMRGWLTSRLEGELSPGIMRGEIVPLGFVSDEELADIYAGATAVVYPSIYEGFGLPPLEAMACGTPAIMSNVSSLPEVAGDAAVLHDPHDIDALGEAMRRFAEDPAFRLDRSVASLRQASRFSWDRCARETVAVYRSVLGRA